MATLANRLMSDGTLLLNGTFDEVTYSGNTSFADKVTIDTIYVTGQFDEVTHSGNTSFARRVANNGNYYVTGMFDEHTGATL